MSKAFKIEGLMNIGKMLAKKASLEDIKTVVKQNGSELQQKMQRNAESMFTAGYSTGETKRQTKLKIVNGGLSAEVQPGTSYSPYLEYGTRKMTAKPFVSTAFNAQMPQFKDDILNALKK